MSQAFWNDLHYLVLFPKKYGDPPDLPQKPKLRGRYWRKVMARYGDTQKKLTQKDFRWHVITFVDGRKELAYLRVLKLGLSPAIYRGLVPRLLTTQQYANIKNIRIAF